MSSELTGDGTAHSGWPGPTRVAAKEWLSAKVAPTGAVEEVDEAGNQWFTLGATPTGRCSSGAHRPVPNGGWLDGVLNVVAGVEVLRRIAADGTPPVTVRLVNWADEEQPAGARRSRAASGR